MTKYYTRSKTNLLKANPNEGGYEDKKIIEILEEEAARYHEGDEERDHFNDQDPLNPFTSLCSQSL